jgi:hypothetical protein
MKTLKLTTLLVGLALVFGTSCGKYEDGPGISFASKKARVANTWVVDKYEEANGDITQEDNSPTIELTKDGEGTISYTFGGTTSTTTVKWEFVDSKEKIKFIYDGGTSTETIMQLKSKEMILKDEDGDKTYYVQK